MGLPRLGRLPIGDLDQDIGIVGHPISRAAREAVLARSLRRDQPLEHTSELVPPAGFGVQFDDYRDSHVVLPGAFPWCSFAPASRTILRMVPLQLDQDG